MRTLIERKLGNGQRLKMFPEISRSTFHDVTLVSRLFIFEEFQSTKQWNCSNKNSISNSMQIPDIERRILDRMES